MKIIPVSFVSKMRLELTQPNGHYPLKVARLPIPPPGQILCGKHREGCNQKRCLSQMRCKIINFPGHMQESGEIIFKNFSLAV